MHFPRAAALFAWVALVSLAPASEPPSLKLGYDIEPVRYAADLTLLTDAAGFNGRVEIDVNLVKPASLIWLNATDIRIHSASVTAAGKSETAAVEPGNQNFIGLRLPAEIAAGPAKIRIEYEGKISDKDTSGIFRSTDAGEKYVYTQFESTDARRAFPCFDQPDFKTPWQLTLHVRKDELTVSNTAQVSETEEANGMKRVVFAPTRPLPSYLVAFGVGHFDVVDAGTTGRNHVPVRIITPKGKSYQAKYAAAVTATIIQRLEDYFGVPFPYDKSDQVAIPVTFGFGAMENAGMVTYAQTLILSDPALDTPARQREYASVAAHELAHQWFGDLVTMKWWDDTWLNEAFATWTSSKILAEWKPEWKTRLDDLGSKFGAMTQDSLVSTRQIRQPIESMDDISNAFDDITYEKGSAVIRMFESWVGEPQFRAGVNTYLKRHAYKNATMGDFLDAISAGGKPQLTRAFSTFLEQPGIPEVSVELNCSAAPALEMSQKRYLPIGSAGGPSRTWQVPVCVRYQTASGPQKECFLLMTPKAEFRLSHAASCPNLVSANDAAAGYYVTAYTPAMREQLLASGTSFLDPAERRTLLHDLSSLVASGDAKESDVLSAVPAFARSPERQIVGQAEGVAGSIQRLVPTNLRPNYARFIRSAFGARATELGWSAKAGEDADTGMLRASLVPFVANAGDDRELQQQAGRLAHQWLKDRQGIDPNMLGVVLSTAARSGDRALFDAMLAEVKKVQDRHQRQTLIAALGNFRDKQIAQSAMNLVLQPDMDARETLSVLLGPLSNRETERLPFEFVRSHYDELVKRLPSGGGFDAGAILPFVGGGFCDESSRKEFVAFFEERAKKFIGGPRNYAQALEGIKLCEAQSAAQGADIAAFLEKQ
jgi:cytosol alanyl aminopeptidase